jgi:hypothetical protein
VVVNPNQGAIMAKGSVKLAGRFRPGTRVRYVKVDGPHVLRAPEGADSKDGEVDDNGEVEFTGLEVGERGFIVGNIDGQPREARTTTRAQDDPNTVLTGYDPYALYDRVKLSDGSFLDEPPKQNQDQEVPEGATWLGQHQVPKGTLQRSDTPRGSAHVISREERERATKQWRKQEPVDAVVENAVDPGDDPARTSEPKDETPAKSGKGR